ncbi:hypothetical protein DM02DRAFT_254143 [Periconia macrospinosa]|uniref:Uncharacterized protein n=1 Tax=Periconia macrospinosa TaxID=97972 RepID=A0A2V1D4K2_9PLEO|nr:hypothetical protein DM02DRAFT_254143 [Periconia macrospinosa]
MHVLPETETSKSFPCRVLQPFTGGFLPKTSSHMHSRLSLSCAETSPVTITPRTSHVPICRARKNDTQSSITNTFSVPSQTEVSLIVRIWRCGITVWVKALIHVCLKKAPFHSESLYRFDELAWPEFQQLNGAADAFESLPEGLYDRIETLQQFFQLGAGGRGDEILFMRAEESYWAILAFGIMKSDGASIEISNEYQGHTPAGKSSGRGGC